MDRSSRIAILNRRQRRALKRAESNALKRRLALLGTVLFASLITLIVVPAAVGGLAWLYLTERTSPDMDNLIEEVAVSTIGFYAENLYNGEVPTPEDVEEGQAREFKTTKIYDRSGQHLLWEVYDPRGGNRQVIALDDISPNLINATIALEDKTFYDNPGIDLRGISRAAIQSLTSGSIQGGGSSITQQLIKLVAIDPEQRYIASPERKITETILAIELSRKYDKDTILEWYLNTINYGNLAYGAEAAAATYFGKNASDLTVAEAALLSIIPNAPATYDPFTQTEVALERQRLALDRMREEGYLTDQMYEEAVAEPVIDHLVRAIYSESLDAPHFTLYALRDLEEILQAQFGSTDLLYNGGLTVYTTLDYDQFQAQQSIARNHLAAIQAGNPESEQPPIDASNAAVVTINPKTGEIVSMVGSIDYRNEAIDGEINMATAPRQPGSSVKPYTYLTALEEGYTAASMVWDVRTVFDDSPNPPYVPENYDRTYRGPILFRDALQQSLNIPAVKVMDWVGVGRVIQTMHRMGINTLREEDVGLSLTLGGGEVTLLDHVYAFSVMANNGTMVGTPVPELQRRPGYRELDPASILMVVDAKENEIYRYDTPETRQVITPQLAYIMQNVMSDNAARAPAFGENNALILPGRPVATKTGSTNDFRDGWTIGYTPQYVTGVWVGNADYRVMIDSEAGEAPGSKVAAPIWQQSMEFIHRGLPPEQFLPPTSIVQVDVCAKSGMLPTPQCPETKRELFVDGTQPTAPDTLFQAVSVCGDSGRLATLSCPADQVRTQVFMMIPPEAEDWARENNIPLPPSTYDSSQTAGVATGPVSIGNPGPYNYVGGIIPITGNAYSTIVIQPTAVPTATPDPNATPTVDPNVTPEVTPTVDPNVPPPTPGADPTIAPVEPVRLTPTPEGGAMHEPPVSVRLAAPLRQEGEPPPVPTETSAPAGIPRGATAFRLYRVLVGQGLNPSNWIQIGPDHYTPVQNGTLEYWDTRGFGNGLYTIQLVMEESTGAVTRSSVQVYVDNVAPTVSISYPYNGAVVELGGDSWLNIQADATDNIALDRVDFYVDGRLFESSSSSFNVRWTLADSGLGAGAQREIEIYAVAYDGAGNSARSEAVRITVQAR